MEHPRLRWWHDWTRNQCVTVAQLCTGHCPLLAAYLHPINGTLPPVHNVMEPMKRQNTWSYTARRVTRLGGSRGPISTTKAIQDACGASWRRSGRWPVPLDGNDRERRSMWICVWTKMVRTRKKKVIDVQRCGYGDRDDVIIFKHCASHHVAYHHWWPMPASCNQFLKQ